MCAAVTDALPPCQTCLPLNGPVIRFNDIMRIGIQVRDTTAKCLTLEKPLGAGGAVRLLLDLSVRTRDADVAVSAREVLGVPLPVHSSQQNQHKYQARSRHARAYRLAAEMLLP